MDPFYRVTFRIDPPETCPFKQTDRRSANLWVDIAEEELRCELLTIDRTSETYSLRKYRRPVDERCPRRIFERHGAIPRQTVEGDHIECTVSLESSERGRRLVDDLGESYADCDIVEFTQVTDPPREAKEIAIDYSKLTDKQRRAIELAAEEGYYEMRADVTIDQLAPMLDISPSAFGKRLKRAERTILSQVLERV